MTTTLALSFPWGLYHATPWGRDVNEASVEWPPSPWRIVRALYATWRWRLPDIPDAVIERILGCLAEPPAYLLPPHTEAHTRHYMPDISYGTDKIFDAFVVMERDAQALIRWPGDLDAEAREALDALARGLSYLGRADSLCEAKLDDAKEGRPDLSAAWLEPFMETGGPSTDIAGRGGAETPHLRTLTPRRPLDLQALTVRTTQVRSAGFVIPPGAEWVSYRKPVPAEPRSTVRRPAHRPPVAVRWAFASSAQPSIKASVALGDVLRQACMGRFGRRFAGEASALFAGKDPVGTPLQGHAHAHYLAFDANEDRLIDHVTLWAPGGLDRREVAALVDLDRLVGHAHISDFRPGRLGLEALGSTTQVVPELAGPARRWLSLTPFAPPRHSHKRQDWDTHIRQQVTEELQRRNFPVPASVRLLPGDWLSFRRYRLRERLEDARTAVGVELTFRADVTGPLVLGALSHFGLGLFVPDHG